MPISLSLSPHFPSSFAFSIKMDRVKPIMAMKVEIRSRKLIKPSVTTPHTLRHYKIGFIDEFAPMVDVPLVLFFPPNSNYNQNFVTHLEGSLKKTLTLFYPLAGRYIEDIRTVDCNDQGVEFIQAQVDTTVEEMLDPKLDLKLINEFIPRKNSNEIVNQANEPILATQVTFFKCGGCALGLSFAHKIGDAFTLSTFVNKWASLSRKDIEVVDHHGLGFTSSSLFPARGLPPLKVGYTTILTCNDEYVTKKISFNKSAISNMKAKVKLNGKTNTHTLSKVQLVSTLIWKIFINIDHEIYGYPRESILVQPINLRNKTISPKDSFGNLWGLIDTTYNTSKMLINFEELTHILTDSVMRTIKAYSKVGQDEHKRIEMVLSSFSRINDIPDTTNLVFLTSWCKLPLYHINLGYGKPIWISNGCFPMKRGMLLIDDAEGNGVEAYVSMRLQDVLYFEKDEDIKAFST